MGYGSEMKCTKCGYMFVSRTGVGFLFPMVYSETEQKAKDGDLGNEVQEFFKEYPDGAIDDEDVTLCCDKCGDLFFGQDLTMYVPKTRKRKTQNYYMKEDLERYFSDYGKYTHTCEKCGANAHIVKPDETLLCPRCKLPLEECKSILWD